MVAIDAARRGWLKVFVSFRTMPSSQPRDRDAYGTVVVRIGFQKTRLMSGRSISGGVCEINRGAGLRRRLLEAGRWFVGEVSACRGSRPGSSHRNFGLPMAPCSRRDHRSDRIPLALVTLRRSAHLRPADLPLLRSGLGPRSDTGTSRESVGLQKSPFQLAFANRLLCRVRRIASAALGDNCRDLSRPVL
jgi:hypothetical protein